MARSSVEKVPSAVSSTVTCTRSWSRRAAWVEAEHARTGSWPKGEEFTERYEPLWIDDLWYSPPVSAEDETFSFQWPRYLQHSAGLGYHSDGTIWGND